MSDAKFNIKCIIIPGVLYVVTGHVTVAATDVNPRLKKPRDLPETSYRVCSVVPSKFSGLARCHLTDVYGRYVFIKATPETKLKLCEVDVYPFREYDDNAILLLLLTL